MEEPVHWCTALKFHLKSPEKSNRAIADEIGVSDSTVLPARRKTTASGEAVEKRVGP